MSYPCSIGVDIGGTKILIMIMNAQRETVFRRKITTEPRLERIIALIAETVEAAGISREQVLGMAVGIPGRVDPESGIVLDAPSLGWTDVPVSQVLSAAFHWPVLVRNDVNYALIGERAQGSGQGLSDLIYLSIGTGVGSALMVHGQLIEGSSASAGEVGFTIETDEVLRGIRMDRTDFGAYEKRASGLALTQQAKALGMSPGEMFQKAHCGNQEAVAVIDRFVVDISVLCANLISLLNPQRLIISGGVSVSMTDILPEIRQLTQALTPNPVDIELSELRGDAGAIGACHAVFNGIKTQGGENV